jgi:hypothetical protein
MTGPAKRNQIQGDVVSGVVVDVVDLERHASSAAVGAAMGEGRENPAPLLLTAAPA